MSVFQIRSWALAAVMLAWMANQADAQIMLGGGSLRYSSFRGPLGGRVTAVQGPFGGGAISVRGPFGGRLNIVRPPAVGVGVYPPSVGFYPPAAGLYPPAAGIFPPTVAPPVGFAPAPPVNWPYTAAFQSQIPPGYPSLMIGESPYYYTPTLPPGSQPAVIGDVNYFVNAGIFYQPYFYQGQTAYVIVER